METTSNSHQKRAAWHWVLFGVAIALTVIWLFLTPHGLLGKADAVGYAVCHQIEVSFLPNQRALFPAVCKVFRLVLGRLTGVDLPGYPRTEGPYAAPRGEPVFWPAGFCLGI
jgi:hypothetical protein